MTDIPKNTRRTGRAAAHKLALGGMLSALATILMFLSFNVPLMPSFIKLDFSELPALIGAYALGPVGGLLICLVKNLVNVTFTTTGGIGELSNFLIGALFVVPAGLIFRKSPTRKGALVGGLVGAAAMATLSVFTNYYVVYPVYTAFMPMDTILGMYRAISPSVETLWDALIRFNLPFTFVKGALSAGMCFVVFKPLERLIRL
ncbi:MAG: ECF transporter S component [Christensenellales bacterium]|jgi:riboflavin transporter FmnP